MQRRFDNIPAILDRAWQHRLPLLESGTNVFRLVDGAADGMEGIAIDYYDGRALAQTTGTPLPPDLQDWPQFRSLYHKRLGAGRNRSECPTHVAGPISDKPFPVAENGLTYLIDFAAGYSQGLFLDQRDTRASVRASSGQGHRLLNCFAYTCSFSVAAASMESETTSIDLSRPALDWGKQNFIANGIDPEPHRFLHGDVFEWFKRLRRRSESYETIILDPPTFSRGKRGGVFRVDPHFTRLLLEALPLLARHASPRRSRPQILCSTNAHAVSPSRFRDLIEEALRAANEPSATWKISRNPMPNDFPGSSHLKSYWLTHSPQSR